MPEYDPNGTLLTRTGGGATWTIKWAGFDKPRWMAKTTSQIVNSQITNSVTVGSEFHYNAARSRVMQLEFNAMDGSGPTQYNRKRIYALGSTLELNYTTAAPALNPTWALDTVRIYVPGPDGIIGAREFHPALATPEKALVYHYDHLGSITATTLHGTGAIAMDGVGKPGKFSEDAWGQRRDPISWNGAPTTTDDGGADSVTPRGFTGHEMLDDLGLVHMNGRIYDPLLGRFLSADIMVQHPGNLQSYNRYTYVMNNPLSLTDPSGFETISDYEERIKKESAAKQAELKEAYKSGGLVGALKYVFSSENREHSAQISNARDGIRGIEEHANLLDRLAGVKVDARKLDDVSPVYKAQEAGFRFFNWILGAEAGGKAVRGDFTGAGKSLARDLALTWAIGKVFGHSGGSETVAADVSEGEVKNITGANNATLEALKDSYRMGMSKPTVSDPALKTIVDKLYRENATVGSGSTAAAVRFELSTGQQVGGRSHVQKASESITALTDWLTTHPSASSADQAAAKNIIIDTKNALSGKN